MTLHVTHISGRGIFHEPHDVPCTTRRPFQFPLHLPPRPTRALFPGWLTLITFVTTCRTTNMQSTALYGINTGRVMEKENKKRERQTSWPRQTTPPPFAPCTRPFALGSGEGARANPSFGHQGGSCTRGNRSFCWS
jgi:hypothetical protein